MIKFLKTLSIILLLLMLYFLWKGYGIIASFCGIIASALMFYEQKKHKP